MPNEDTTILSNSSATPSLPKSESTIFGMSVRAIIVLMVVSTLCLLQLLLPILGYLVSGDMVIEIKEPYYSVVGMSVAFYFGQKTSGK